MNIDEMSEVMQAYKDGAEIESRRRGCGVEWFPTPFPQWDWASFDYRVKKEPVRVRLFRLDKDQPWTVVDERFSVHPDAEVITVEQVDG